MTSFLVLKAGENFEYTINQVSVHKRMKKINYSMIIKQNKIFSGDQPCQMAER